METLPYPTTSQEIAFLYGDLGFGRDQVAKLTETSPRLIEAETQSQERARHDGYTRAAVHRFERYTGEALKAATCASWPELREALKQSVLAHYPAIGFRLAVRRFVSELSFIQAAARRRASPLRIELLCRDLKFTKAQVVSLLDVTPSMVDDAITAGGIERVGPGELLNSLADFDTLADFLGEPRWDVAFDGKDSQQQIFSRFRGFARQRIADIASTDGLDWSAVDGAIGALDLQRVRRSERAHAGERYLRAGG